MKKSAIVVSKSAKITNTKIKFLRPLDLESIRYRIESKYIIRISPRSTNILKGWAESFSKCKNTHFMDKAKNLMIV